MDIGTLTKEDFKDHVRAVLSNQADTFIRDADNPKMFQAIRFADRALAERVADELGYDALVDTYDGPWKHPLQNVEVDDRDGVVRFQRNEIVRFLLDAGPFDLNKLAAMDFSDEDHTQFAQLIGYSLSGFMDLSFVDPSIKDEVYRILDREVRKRDGS